MTKFKLVAVVLGALAGASCAMEGDKFLEIGPTAQYVSEDALSGLSMGATGAFLFGFNDQTDLGVYGTFHTVGRDNGSSVETFAAGVQSWYAPIGGDIRPQMGGRLGVATRNSNPLVELAAQARGLVELTPEFRLFAGGIAGADLGEHGVTFLGIDFGAQIRF